MMPQWCHLRFKRYLSLPRTNKKNQPSRPYVAVRAFSNSKVSVFSSLKVHILHITLPISMPSLLFPRARVNGHLFQPKRFSQTASCAFCRDRIWGLGRQGYKCNLCKLLVHKKCHKLVSIECQGWYIFSVL